MDKILAPAKEFIKKSTIATENAQDIQIIATKKSILETAEIKKVLLIEAYIVFPNALIQIPRSNGV